MLKVNGPAFIRKNNNVPWVANGPSLPNDGFYTWRKSINVSTTADDFLLFASSGSYAFGTVVIDVGNHTEDITFVEIVGHARSEVDLFQALICNIQGSHGKHGVGIMVCHKFCFTNKRKKRTLKTPILRF